ncbi:MAG TPA: energy transducer TonB, partial [Casimicrobiaceae bacterium]|nr:energy transducer TonB [Casimicrobiaceae bacterium]
MLAALVSLLLHGALFWLPLRLPDRVDDLPPLLATITELPPPPAPPEVGPTPRPQPRHRHVRIR